MVTAYFLREAPLESSFGISHPQLCCHIKMQKKLWKNTLIKFTTIGDRHVSIALIKNMKSSLVHLEVFFIMVP